jgi:hypothetical protein
MEQNAQTNTQTNTNMNQAQPIIVGLDIGTTKIAAIAGRKNEFGKLEILGFGRANSNGVQHGMVLNIDQTIKAIQIALEKCYESNPELEISEVYVGIAGHHIKSLQTRGDIVRQSNEDEITQDEIDRLVEDQYRTYIPFVSVQLTKSIKEYIMQSAVFVMKVIHQVVNVDYFTFLQNIIFTALTADVLGTRLIGYRKYQVNSTLKY